MQRPPRWGSPPGSTLTRGPGSWLYQEVGDDLLAVLGEAGQQLEVSLDGLTTRLAQDPGQHRICGQEVRQLAPSDEPVGEVEEPLGRGVAA